jgi:hypothetical protein
MRYTLRVGATVDDLDADLIWTEAQDLAEDLADAGGNHDRVAAAVATFLDAIVPLDLLVPGPGGIALEAIDGAAFERVVKALVEAFRKDPAKRAERKARRTARNAARVARRASKRSTQ